MTEVLDYEATVLFEVGERRVCGAPISRARGGRSTCSLPAMRDAADQCFLRCADHHEWEPGERGDAPFGVTAEGLISLSSMWYRAARVERFIRAHIDDGAAELYASTSEWAARRWYSIRAEHEWVSLVTVDKLFAHLHLSLYELGDPDACSGRPPDPRSGYIPVPYAEAMRRVEALAARPCDYCGAQITSRHKQARYCSMRCRYDADKSPSRKAVA